MLSSKKGLLVLTMIAVLIAGAFAAIPACSFASPESPLAEDAPLPEVRANVAPVAEAGANITIEQGWTFTLDGTASSDSDGYIADFSWTIRNSTGVAVLNLTGAVAFGSLLEMGVYNVTLTVVDNGTAPLNDTDCTFLTVVKAVSPTVSSPVGTPLSPVRVGTWVNFTATGSDNETAVENLTYAWTLNGVPVPASNSTMISLNLTVGGANQIQVTVIDADGNNRSAVVLYFVDIVNPSASAGPDRSTNEDVLITFDASASTDNMGIGNYTWTFKDTSSKTLFGISPAYVFTAPGEYNITLNVTDLVGNWDEDFFILTVVDTTLPIANAGSDFTANEDYATDFDASASTDNVGVVNYTWTFDDGGMVSIYGVKPSYTFTTRGDYTVTLKATDASGLFSTDTVAVEVVNRPPTASAGVDIFAVPGETVNLSASGSLDPENEPLQSYKWTFEYDGSQQVLTGADEEFTFDIRGVYEVTLTVTDSLGQSNTTQILVTVADPVSEGAGSSDDDGLGIWFWIIVIIIVIVIVVIVVIVIKRRREDDEDDFEMTAHGSSDAGKAPSGEKSGKGPQEPEK